MKSKRILQTQLMVKALADKYYEFEGSGGTLHVLLDDHNYGPGFVDLEWSKQHNDYFGEILGKLLMELTAEEQEQALERSWEVVEEVNNLDRLID
jgi:hypothetical protein